MGFATHSICKYNLCLQPSEYRWWSSLRSVHQHNKDAALKHFIKCKNNETDCVCCI